MKNLETIQEFSIIGISVRTNNTDNNASVDLGVLWERFYLENIRNQITNRISEDIYCVYTDYASDYKGEYTAIIGYKVDSIDFIPDGMTSCSISQGNFLKYNLKGNIASVASVWQKIWAEDSVLNREYSADFDVYKSISTDIDHIDMDVFVAVSLR
ncbi:effector binding domain-containing protein [Apibacter raozihei]|uniref:GyrI-like domain-containing protein n=1 Tax=Apibacter raozihei TaxID=2500547 RepID=UPI000FE3D87E|nr:effector binding domain-containing protein [Apibacter raozihei]